MLIVQGMIKMTKYSPAKFLPRELQHTPIGKRYVRACLIMRMTALEVKIMFGNLRLRRTTRDLIEPRIHHCRRRYMTYSNLASVALDELAKTYNWPPESAADESFTWPPAPVPISWIQRLKRRSRRAVLRHNCRN
jgi:hypothetical protein